MGPLQMVHSLAAFARCFRYNTARLTAMQAVGAVYEKT